MTDTKVAETTTKNTNQPIKTFTPAYTKPACFHDGDKIVWQYNGTNFVIADKYGIDHWKNGVRADIVLDLNRNLSPGGKPLVLSGPDRFKQLNQYVIKPAYELVQLDWADMSILPATLQFWEEMLDALTESKAKGHTVMITCHGGHGRSGTALAALMVASGISSSVAIARVRGKHCYSAIETSGQENYLKWLATMAHAAEPTAAEPTPFTEATKDTIRPHEYCVHCGRDFAEPSLDSDTCMECAEDLLMQKEIDELDNETATANAAAKNVFWPDADYTGANDDALYG